MAQLRAFKDTGQILFDTNLISYGLVKSGYMSWLQSWSRRQLRSINLDPNNGANWNPVIVYSPGSEARSAQSDQVYGFTVNDALSPIVFITGSGTLAGSAVSGNSITFFYTNASTSTKFYCFDLMSNNFSGSPYLKTYDTSGRITFNSLQPPLNIVSAITPPGPPSTTAPSGRYYSTYVNGVYYKRAYVSTNGIFATKVDCIYDVNLENIEYAAFLNFSRSANCIDTFESPGGGTAQYSVNEGAYGRVGGISFMFGASGGTNFARPGGGNYSPATYSNIPVDKFPTALVIKTASYPFPFN